MEASGVAVGADLHSTHWFVVRGVVDYCDDNKNQLWHPYASLAAAAYVRALLEQCRSFAGSGRNHHTVDSDRNSAARPWPASANRRGNLAVILDALLDIPQMRDDYQRRAVMSLLPDHIRTMIADNVNGRLHVLAMVATCVDADDGQESLLRALRLSLPAESGELRRAAAAIEEYWPRRPSFGSPAGP
jgi:hypothetical protein